jgi:pseudouridine-5'-phosphate glycosidase
MEPRLPRFYQIGVAVAQALRLGLPVVALESTVITHGLPYPENLQLAQDLEGEVRRQQATPATIAILDGKVRVGLEAADLARLAAAGQAYQKVSGRDFCRLITRDESGGTTVAGTLLVAQRVGIRVFTTGGIGGVHREPPTDISADLTQLAHSPVIVVCSGAKAILDLPATVEFLETWGVPVVGYQTDSFPAFYGTSSGLPVSARADSPAEVSALAQAHWQMGLQSAVLVTVPPPIDLALPVEQIERAIHIALREARSAGMRGQAVTPFLLARVSQLTESASLAVNLALLRNNARVAGQIARELSENGRGKSL